MVQLKKVGVLSAAKMYAITAAILSVILCAILLVVGVGIFVFGGTQQRWTGAMLVGEAIVLPLFYAGFAFLFGALAAWIYNLVAEKFGGLELEFRETAAALMTGPTPAQTTPEV